MHHLWTKEHSNPARNKIHKQYLTMCRHASIRIKQSLYRCLQPLTGLGKKKVFGGEFRATSHVTLLLSFMVSFQPASFRHELFLVDSKDYQHRIGSLLLRFIHVIAIISEAYHKSPKTSYDCSVVRHIQIFDTIAKTSDDSIDFIYWAFRLYFHKSLQVLADVACIHV